jgi:arylformamidase
MKYYDVSMMINQDMQVYKNKAHKKPKLSVDSNFQTGTTYESRLEMNLHTGTHMDFSKHIIENGKTSITEDLNQLIRKVKVFDLSHLKSKISKNDLEDYQIEQDDFVLLKTRNSFSDTFDFNFVFLDESAALYLASLKVKGVGIDALGIERDQEGYPTHKTCFNHEIIIIEGLRLESVSEGVYFMIASPLKIYDVEALPLRVLLFEIGEHDEHPFSNH